VTISEVKFTWSTLKCVMARLPLPTLLRWISVPLTISVLASTVKSFIAGPWWIVAYVVGALCLLVWAVALFVSAALALRRRNWKRAVLLPLAFVFSFPLIVLGLFSGDYLHLTVMYPYYAFIIHSHPDWQSKEIRFDWGDESVTVLDGLQERMLIYDASGKTVVGNRPYQGDGELRVDVQHLVGNFYLERRSSQ
jgi:hypothetical protein